jgi:hypothetical protein
MRCVAAAFAIGGQIILFQPVDGRADPLDLDKVITEETPEQLCDRLILLRASGPKSGLILSVLSISTVPFPLAQRP